MSILSVLYGDDPLDGVAGAKDREELVVRIVKSLNLMQTRTESAVVALVGPWGCGKTTVLNAVEAGLTEDGGWHLARYNPWSYSSLDNAIPGFFAELNSALPKDARTKRTRKTIGSWVSKLSPLGGLVSFAGADVSGAMKGLAQWIAGDESPETLRAKVADDLKQLDKPVLMLIDDLDRLGPDELLTTFKLVRMLGRLPNVHYLLCYDEATLIDVLQRTGLVDNVDGRARAYLEKMIQLRLDIPTLMTGAQLDLVNLVLKEVQSNHSLELLPSEEQRLSTMWGEYMRPYLTHPRAIKRLFTQVDATWSDVQGEVDFPDWVAMTFLRTFEPAVFSLVEEHDSELLGRFSDWDPLMKETNEEKMVRWRGYLTGLNVVHPSKVMGLLTELFLVLKSARDKTAYGAAARADVGRRCGVGHQDYFHRYTQAGIPADDLPNSKVAVALEQLRNGVPGDAAAFMEEFLTKDAGKVVQKILRHDIAELPLEPLMLMLARQYDVLGTGQAGVLAGPPSYEFLDMGIRILSELDGEFALQLLSDCAATSSGLSFASDLLRRIGREDHGAEMPSWFREAERSAANAIEAGLRNSDPSGSDVEIECAMRGVWALREFAGEDRVTRLLWDLIQGDNEWTVSLVIATLYPIGHDSEGQWTVDRENLPADAIQQLLGFERTVEAVKAQGPANLAVVSPRRFDSRPSLKARAGLVYEDVLELEQHVLRAGGGRRD